MEVKKIPKKTVTLIEPKRSVLVDKEKYHQKRVAAYCRVSTDSEEQLTSYVNQKKFYTDMIARTLNGNSPACTLTKVSREHAQISARSSIT